MMRRQPTLIPMSESDVQEVRDMVAQQKAEAVAMAKWEEDNRKRQEAPALELVCASPRHCARVLRMNLAAIYVP
ncbi:hypothetical protein BD626DRAFT_473913 [Schizophyllum amplum]|uniref:Uncharacterized protein n=1 Tax=Schizophyllum amplum TaxID=97359 RepID=A0A550CX72_9AGAR|nr:hypothetical protein BD626DRAFT_473913 [Auriculariopsis ampla]